MLARRKFARDFLLSADRPTFLEIVYRAKVSPVQKEIIYMDLLDGYDHRFIGDKIGLTETAVNHQIGKAYDLIYNYISSTVLGQNPDIFL